MTAGIRLPLEGLFMNFLNALRQLLSGAETVETAGSEPAAGAPAAPAPRPGIANETISPTDKDGYDRIQWRRKLRRAMEEYPESRDELGGIDSEARALAFDPEWVRACKLEDFTWMVRRIVSDRVITSAEHIRLDEARQTLGISETEATEILRGIVKEAESVFDRNVEGA